jgi:hypothetical protein
MRHIRERNMEAEALAEEFPVETYRRGKAAV